MFTRPCETLFLSNRQPRIWEIGRVASEEVIVQLTRSKCMLLLLYGYKFVNLPNHRSRRSILCRIDSSWKCARQITSCQM